MVTHERAMLPSLFIALCCSTIMNTVVQRRQNVVVNMLSCLKHKALDALPDTTPFNLTANPVFGGEPSPWRKHQLARPQVDKDKF